MTSSTARRSHPADSVVVSLLRNICVYCGSSPGSSAVYGAAARELADELVRQGLGLVYGGSSKGIMGILADRMLEHGGHVVGIIPESLLKKEIGHDGISELHIVDSMHTRKAMMAERSDAFIAMPGGTGTLEEIIETVTWAQLRFHKKPCGLLNTNHYFDHLIAFLDHAVEQGFLRPAHRNILQVHERPPELLRKFGEYQPALVDKWVD